MDRDKLIEIIDKNEHWSSFKQDSINIADALIANNIGDITAETANWDTLCNKLGNIIAQGNDCENLCCQGFLDMVNEIKHYDGEYDRQLQAEKNRADIAEEALKMFCMSKADADCPYDRSKEKCKACLENGLCSTESATECYMDYYKQQAEERLKEKK